MKTLSATLTAGQKATHIPPLVKIVLTHKKLLYDGEVSDTGNAAAAEKSFTAVNCTGLTKANGFLIIDLKAADASKLGTNNQIEITSSGGADTNEWYIAAPISEVTTAWQTFTLPLVDAVTTGGELDVTAIDYLRWYNFSTDGDVTIYWRKAYIRYLDIQTYTKTRILDVRFTAEDDRQNAEVLLDNSDGTLTDLDFKGYQGVISKGITTSEGDEYSAKPPLKVVAQQLLSAQGKLVCHLGLAGIPNQVAEDRANAKYIPDEDDNKTVKTLIREIFGDSGATLLAVYDHCDSYDVTFDSEDSLIDSFKPKDSFAIYEGASRLSKIKELLAFTKCVMRIESDGEPHIFEPTTSGESYDYEYSLASGYHTFFAKTYRKRLVIPNYIIVRSLLSQSTPYSGYAEDTASSDLMEKRKYYRFRVESNAQCTAIATAILSRYQLDAERGHGFIPMNVGAEIHDYVKITDSREDDSRTGNIRFLSEHVDLQKKIWEMEFRFGTPDMAGLMGTRPPSSSGAMDLSEILALMQQIFAWLESLAAQQEAILAYLEWWRQYIFIDDAGDIVLRADSGAWVQIFNDLSLTCSKNFGMMLATGAACRLFWYTKGGTLDHVFCPEVDGTGKIGDATYAFLEGRFKKAYVPTRLKIPVGTDMYD